MENRTTRILLTIFFLGLLATPAIIRHLTAHSQPVHGASPAAAIARYGFHLEEVSHQAGIDFTHQAPVCDPKLANIAPIISSMGASVSIVDFDKDGWLDIYVTNSAPGSKNKFYHNLGNGKFEEIADKLGIADLNQPGTGVCMGAVWGDYDNDGYEDLLIYKWGKVELYHNDQGKGFTRVAEAGLPAWMNCNNAVWVDYDRDGKLDLLLTGYFPDDVDLQHLKNTRMMPDSFEYAKNGGRKYLFRNLGNGKFQDVTAEVGLNSHGWTLASIAADLRGTGYPDIVLANDYGVSEFYASQGGKRFREIGKACGVGYAPKSGMSASIGDILNEGKFALYVTNISEEGVLMQGNNLWVPRSGASGDAPVYDNMAHDMGVELGGWSFGAQFGDLNNDGNLDLYCVNGYISADRDKNFWYDYSKIAGGNSAIISDAQNWPTIGNRSLSGYQQKRVWLNDGAGKFVEVAQMVGANDTYDGRAVALGDFGNHGMLDVVVANQRGPLLFYRNTVTPDNKWIEFELEGTKSNRSAIGAQVRLFWNGQQQVQEVLGGSGFAAQNMRRLHFGLGKNPHIEKALIRWPSGQTQILTSPEIGVNHKVKEPN